MCAWRMRGVCVHVHLCVHTCSSKVLSTPWVHEVFSAGEDSLKPRLCFAPRRHSLHRDLAPHSLKAAPT